MFHYSRRVRWAAICLILLSAAAIRLIGLNRVPPGLSHDEAYNGITALQVLLEGRRSIFFDIYNGIEPLIIYWQALYLRLFGIVPLAMRLVNVTAGLLTVALTYPVAYRLFEKTSPRRAHWLATLSAAGVALSFWAVFISRLALRAVTLPLFELPAVYCLWRGFTADRSTHKTRYLLWFLAAGAAAGAAMYTYLASRFLPLLPLVFLGYLLMRRQVRRHHWLGVLVFYAAWGVVFAPLAGYYLAHPDIFSQRANQVLTLPAALAGNFLPLLTSTWHTLASFGLIGPGSSRYGLAGKPIFEPIGAVFFVVGLAVTIARLRRPRQEAMPYALLLIWWIVLLVPDFITSESPHYLRMVGALPPTYILWALGLVTVVDWLRGRVPRLRRLLIPAVLAYLLLVTGVTVFDYFGRWASDVEARGIYGAEFTEAVAYLDTHQLPGPAAISSAYYRDWDRFRLDLQTGHHPPFVLWFYGPQTLLLPPPGADMRPTYLFLASAPPHPRWLDYLQLDTLGRDMAAYTLKPAFPTQLENELDAVIGARLDETDALYPVVRLDGYEIDALPQAGRQLPILLYWTALRDVPGSPDYAFFVHLRDDQGRSWAQIDANGFDAVDWQPDVNVLQWLNLDLPPDLPPIAYTLQLGLEDRSTGEVLPVISASGNSEGVVLQTIQPAVASPPPNAEDFTVPNAMQSSIDDIFVLRGYSASPLFVEPGTPVEVSLFWQVQRTPGQAYRIVFRLDCEDGRGALLAERQPLDGEYPTDLWQAGQWVRDRVSLVPPATLAGQQCDLFAGWRQEDGTWLSKEPVPGIRLTTLFLAQ